MTRSTISANFTTSLKEFKNQVDWVGLRFYSEKTNQHTIRNEHPESHSSKRDQGVMIEVMVDGHLGYAATSNLTPEGMKHAFNKARTFNSSLARKGR